MKRLLIIGGVIVIALAVGVYRAKLGAQENEARITKLEADKRKVANDIAVMKAEETYLSRPERIGPMARDKLGLVPATPDQYTAPEAVQRRVGGEQPAAATLPEPAPTPTPSAKPKGAPKASPSTQPSPASMTTTPSPSPRGGAQ